MRLIDADLLKKDVLNLADCYNGFSETYDKACIIGLIDEQPTVEEQKSGNWLWLDGVRCSNCNFKLQTTGLPSYCPNCKVKMKGKNG